MVVFAGHENDHPRKCHVPASLPASDRPCRTPAREKDTMMNRATDSLPPRLLRTTEAGRFLGLSGRTLEKHRTLGTGPNYHKLGGRVVYSLADLTAWLERSARTSTHDKPAFPHHDGEHA